jgi:hypothetical protein
VWSLGLCALEETLHTYIIYIYMLHCQPVVLCCTLPAYPCTACAAGAYPLSAHSQRYTLYREELPLRNTDLSHERAIAQSDLVRALGTLR